MYIGRQNGILVRLRGGLLTDDKTEFFPTTLSFISNLMSPMEDVAFRDESKTEFFPAVA